MPGTRHYYFLDSIGQGDWFSYGSTLQDLRYAVEGYGFFDSDAAPDAALPEALVLHFPCCYGGDVWEGYGMYNYLRGLAQRGVKVTSQVEGLCASIATLVALAADEVLMGDTAFWMVHKPWLDAYGANADELAAATLLLNKIQAQLAGRYVARSGGKLDLPTANSLMDQTSWLTADECLGYGFITGKLEEAPLVVPAGAEKVLNYLSKTALKPAAMATMTEKEEKSFMQKVGEVFGLTPKAAAVKPAASAKPKAQEAATPPAAPTPPAAVTPPADEVTPANAMMGTEFPLADGTSVFVDTSDDDIEDIDEGDAVFTDEAMTTPCADGDYVLEDGRGFSVLDGAVSAIDEAVDSAAPAPTEAAQAKAAAKPKAMSPAAQLKVAQNRAARAEAALAAHVPGSAGNPNQPGAQNFPSADAGSTHPLDADAQRAKAKLKGRS